ncbi:hypothetical protein [Hydrocarboniphaga effusa]|uniref:hypothetical protein n=1 Tax=Hydrocarboniphaga effusa TaxID=243629 RepID=UPI003BAC8B93
MRAWVFTEDKIEPALTRFRESLGTLVATDDADMIVSGIRGFLTSPEALKLRVRECEPDETPPPKPEPAPAPRADINQQHLELR